MTTIPDTRSTVLGFVIATLLHPIILHSQTPATDSRIPRQSETVLGAVQGVVLNPGGLGLGGAVVTLRMTAGRAHETITTGDGVYRFLNLSPGTYGLIIAIEGFEPFQRDGIFVEKGESFNLESILQPVASGNEVRVQRH